MKKENYNSKRNQNVKTINDNICIGGRIFKSKSEFEQKVNAAVLRKNKTYEDMEVLEADMWRQYEEAGMNEVNPMYVICSKLAMSSNVLISDGKKLSLDDLDMPERIRWKVAFKELEITNNAKFFYYVDGNRIAVQICNFGQVCIFEVNNDRYLTITRDDDGLITNEDIMTTFFILTGRLGEQIEKNEELWDIDLKTAPYKYLDKAMFEFRHSKGVEVEDAGCGLVSVSGKF